MQLDFGAATDPGRVRRRNEDVYVARPDLGLFAVVDGMGGHQSGEVASKTVASGLLDFIRATALDPDKTWPMGYDPDLSDPANRLQVAIRSANRKLSDLVVSDESLGGSGATISAALFAEDRLVVSNVGDCRVYLIREDTTWQITRDHSLVGEQMAMGLIDSTEARNHPLRHVVTRAVLGDAGISVDTWEIRVEAGDRVLLCSDGIHSMLSDAEIRGLAITEGQALPDTCRAIVNAANANGGKDNATVVLIEVRRDTTPN
jgi:serine/threonine protein phosphatase PrpC